MKKEFGILAAGAVLSIAGCSPSQEPNTTSAPIENSDAVIVDLGHIGNTHEAYKITDKNGQDCYVVVNIWKSDNSPVAISCPVETK